MTEKCDYFYALDFISLIGTEAVKVVRHKGETTKFKFPKSI